MELLMRARAKAVSDGGAAFAAPAAATISATFLAAALSAASPALATAPALESVTPFKVGGVLEATVRTTDFPGDRLSASLKSGLPAAIEMHLTALDRKNRAVAENHLFFRIAWDLWDEVVKVDGPRESRQLESLAALSGFLDEMPDLPVGPLAALGRSASHRVRVDCRLHPVAPRETERLTRWVAGENEGGTSRETDGREVSVGLSDVIRFFYKGSKKDADELDPRFSAWFTPAELPEGGAK